LTPAVAEDRIVGDDQAMTQPFLLAQLSDPHIGADWAEADSVAGLAAAVASVRNIRLDWLDAELAAAPELPTLVAMHHPPLATGVRAWDELGLPLADRQALGAVVARHRQVRRLVSGHVHRMVTAELGGRPVLTVPSTYVQGRLDFLSTQDELSDDPAGFALHAVVDGELISHVQPVRIGGHRLE
jgi:3',5'-cyclic AMP phosphodiesterase CpdA